MVSKRNKSINITEESFENFTKATLKECREQSKLLNERKMRNKQSQLTQYQTVNFI